MGNGTNTYFKFKFRNRDFSVEWRYCESIDESAFVVHETTKGCVMFIGYFIYDWDFSDNISDHFRESFGVWLDGYDKTMCDENENDNATEPVEEYPAPPCVIYEVSTTITEKTHKILSEKKKFFYSEEDAMEHLHNQTKLVYELFGDNSLTKISSNSKFENEFMSRVNNDICITIKCTIQHID